MENENGGGNLSGMAGASSAPFDPRSSAKELEKTAVEYRLPAFSGPSNPLFLIRSDFGSLITLPRSSSISKPLREKNFDPVAAHVTALCASDPERVSPSLRLGPQKKKKQFVTESII